MTPLTQYASHKENGSYKFSIRSMLIAPKDKLLIHWDLKQAESWVVAHMADEPRMKMALKHGDIHRLTAAVIYELPQAKGATVDQFDKPEFWISLADGSITKVMRYVGKQQNHAKAYREGYVRAAEIINRQSDKPPYVVVTVGESKLYDRRWHGFYNVKPWWSEIEYDLEAGNRALITPYGRVRVFFERWGNELFKQATAHLPQSTVADHTNGAVQDELGIEGGLIEINKQMVDKGLCLLVGQGHDSVTVECEKEKKDEVIGLGTKLLKRPLVIKGETFTIPVECSVGERYGELEEVNV
jgi:hypothetical protein